MHHEQAKDQAPKAARTNGVIDSERQKSTRKDIAAVSYEKESCEDGKCTEGLALWYLTLKDPVFATMPDHCRKRKIHWQKVLKAAIAMFLREKGAL